MIMSGGVWGHLGLPCHVASECLRPGVLASRVRDGHWRSILGGMEMPLYSPTVPGVDAWLKSGGRRQVPGTHLCMPLRLPP